MCVWVVVLYTHTRARRIELSDGFGSGKGSGPGRLHRHRPFVAMETRPRRKGPVALMCIYSSTGEKCFQPYSSTHHFAIVPNPHSPLTITRARACVCAETIQLLPITRSLSPTPSLHIPYFIP